MHSRSQFFSLLGLSTVLGILLQLTAAAPPASPGSSDSNDSAQCLALSAQLGDKVLYPNGSMYMSSVQSYWFQEARLSPTCIVRPTSSSDVSTIVKTLARLRAVGPNNTFAIRSGGHTPFAGAAGTDRGVTVDLGAMNQVSISADRKIVSVGSGSIWSDIYSQIQPMELSAVGGRVAPIGVGGFITGGGISFFSPEKGFGCDNVAKIEVVLASGQVVEASAQSNSDLFAALKGGSNNFGIVTRFDLQTVSIGNFWGGFIYYPSTTVPQQLSAFNSFMQPANFDPNAAVVQAIGYISGVGSLVSNGIFYTKPVVNPPVLQPITGIQPQLGSSMRLSTMVDFVTEEEQAQAVNPRGIYVTTTFSPTLSVFQRVYAIWNATVPSIENIAGIQHFIIFQPMPAIKPGNSLGLSASEGPLVVCLLSITWTNPGDDPFLNTLGQNLIGQIEQATKSAGVFNAFKYLNYAAKFQDPIGSYGAASKTNLQAISRKYDPTGLFQTTVPGGFKLFT